MNEQIIQQLIDASSRNAKLMYIVIALMVFSTVLKVVEYWQLRDAVRKLFALLTIFKGWWQSIRASHSDATRTLAAIKSGSDEAPSKADLQRIEATIPEATVELIEKKAGDSGQMPVVRQ